MSTYTSGQMAEASGFTIETLRYYERIGLLGGVERDSAGRRAFTDQDLRWLEILRCLRDTGMPIATMQRYAELALQDGSVEERLEILEEHDRAVSAEMEQLSRYRHHLREKIASYRAGLRAAG